MKAKSISGNSPEHIRIHLEQCIANGYSPTLAIVFISIKQDRKEVCEILEKQGIDIVGATSSQEFIAHHQSAGEIAILLLDLNREHYTILLEDIGDRSVDEAATYFSKRALQKFNKPAFILLSTLLATDGRIMDGELLIRSIEEAVGPQVTLFGGMAGDDITFTGTYVFTKDQSTDYGMMALVLNEEKIQLLGVAISGWKPVGVTRIITKSEGNLLYTIDDKPALEMYLRYLGSDIPSMEDQIVFFESLGTQYPFQIQRENRTPLMCNPIGYDREKGALICEAMITEGSTFRFSMPPDFDIVDTIIEKAKTIKNEAAIQADALLIFSCAGRLAALGPMAQQENDGLQAVWHVPMAGFYTYGEFGKAENGKHEFHSTTNSWVVLNEK